MAIDIEFISPSDKPALVAATDPEVLDAARTALVELGYKVQAAANTEDFSAKFAQIQYQVLVIDGLFDCPDRTQNATLQKFQWMPMPQRRHCTAFLIATDLESLNAKLAYNQSVHAIVNRNDVPSLKKIIQQVVLDNEMFLNVYRETQTRLAQGK
jgi:hypothetical protein